MDFVYLSAIELSLVDSTILVFTDADAKDAFKMSEVQTTALSKQIKITTLRTGQCGTKKQYFDSGKKLIKTIVSSQHLIVKEYL